MKHSLQLRLSQHLTLTPQLQQSIRLLQLSTLELNQELERFLQENPLLEREDDIAEGAPPPSGEIYADTPSTTTREETEEQPPERSNGELDATALTSFDDERFAAGLRDDDEDSEFPQLPAGIPSLREHLLSQTGFTAMSEHDRVLVSLLIDALDDSGFIAQPLEEIAQM